VLRLNGQLVNLFRTVRGEKDGRQYGGEWKVQLLSQVPAEDGTSKFEMVDLKVKDPEPFRDRRGQECEIPVGVFAPSKGSVVFFVAGTPSFTPPARAAAPAK
jgi:hypothetical protein